MTNQEDVKVRTVKTLKLQAQVIESYDESGSITLAVRGLGRVGEEAGAFSMYDVLELPTLSAKLAAAMLEALDSFDNESEPEFYNILSHTLEQLSEYRDPRVRIGNNRII